MTSTAWLSSSIRRVVDTLAALGVAIVLSPVVAIVALMVRRAHGRPVIFRQERAGLHGKPIMVPKFRSMTNERGPNGEPLPDEERLTPLGRRLRSTSLDELPQLWSVIKGDMSLVGPRPLPMRYVDRYSAEQRRRLDAKAGITGWAQVQGRNALSWNEKLALDVWYVDNASPRLDLAALLRTVRAVIRPEGVNAEGHATMHEFMGEP